MSGTIRILGVDPGLSAMGWGVIDVAGTRLTHVAHGVIATRPSLGLASRLAALHRELCAIIAAHAPAAMSVDPSAALKLGHARAIALLAGAQAGLDIAEYTPNHIKKCVVGAGHAGKDQVLFMVARLLPAARVTGGSLGADAADALAAAITHGHLAGARPLKEVAR